MKESPFSWFKINPYLDGGWFWSRYSLNPYNKCSFGCSYCFLRQKEYQLKSGPKQIDLDIDKLRQELTALPRDVIAISGYQTEEEYEKRLPPLLQICADLSFPTVIITRSSLTLRDIELIKQIQKNGWVAVIISINYFQSEGYLEIFEPHTPSIEERFWAMQELSSADIFVGTALMPILPGVTDSDENLEKIVDQTKNYGGKFVLAGGLVLSEDQKNSFYHSLNKFNPKLIPLYEKLYHQSFSPLDDSWTESGRKVKQLCLDHGLAYRLPRYIDKEDPFALAKKENERRYLELYEMELNGVSETTISSMRKELQALENSYFS